LFICSKPTTHRAKRALQAREPKLVENTKNTLFIRGRKTSAVVVNCMKDLVRDARFFHI
jgi:ribosome production factor 2